MQMMEGQNLQSKNSQNSIGFGNGPEINIKTMIFQQLKIPEKQTCISCKTKFWS